MKFDKSRVYTALDADELKVGSKVFVAKNMYALRRQAIDKDNTCTLLRIRSDDWQDRFVVMFDSNRVTAVSTLAYLISEPEEEIKKAIDKGFKELKYPTYDYDIYRQGYLAGFKAGKEETTWHDLRKDPNDLPNDIRYVWTNVGAGCHYDDGWYDDYGRLHDVIAWCEPKFEEVK